jgi:carboxylate-amine ligase
LTAAGFIESHRELWWDVRPNHEHGTVEVRICDMPPDLPGVLGLTALIQGLVHDLSRADDRREPPDGDHSLMIRQNRWRACRYGLGAVLVEPDTLKATPARAVAEGLVDRLQEVAEELGSARHLRRIREMSASPTGADRQLAIYEETGDLAEVVHRMVARSTLEPPSLLPPMGNDTAMPGHQVRPVNGSPRPGLGVEWLDASGVK